MLPVKRLVPRWAARNFNSSSFGLVFDVDGVIQRGGQLLPRTKEAFKLLVDENHKFMVPTVFLTNGTNCLRKEKADKLAHLLGIHIAPWQILMAHSPLRMFKDLHQKNVLVVGQNHARFIAHAMGFKRVTTIEDLRTAFPELDCVDFARVKFSEAQTKKLRANFKPIDAIVMLGEPLVWESALQLIIDVLLTDGHVATGKRAPFSGSHIPLIACNVDLVWMAERLVSLPRFGHGVFLSCLEAIYHGYTGGSLHYDAVLGKPNEISFLHAAHMLQRCANDMKREPVKTLYIIGDNPMSDVLGARLFDRYLRHGGRGRFDHLDLDVFEESDPPEIRTRHVVERCVPFLVETGVYKEGSYNPSAIQHVESLTAGEREQLLRPEFVEYDVFAAVRTILSRERARR